MTGLAAGRIEPQLRKGSFVLPTTISISVRRSSGAPCLIEAGSHYTGYAKLGCRCPACRAAAAVVHKRARHALLTRQPILVDAEAVRAHLTRLSAAGMSRSEVERRCGVSRVTLLRITRGDLTRVHRGTAAAILGVSPVPFGDQRAGWVDGTGTRRRLRALMAAGWPASRLAARLGTSQSHIRRLVEDGHRCSAVTRAQVADLFDELWDVAPPEDKSARLARRRAQMQGWLRAMAWDDDEIDDPTAQPHTPTGGRSALLENVVWLAGLGDTLPGICLRLGVQPESIWRAAYRQDRLDIWARLTAPELDTQAASAWPWAERGRATGAA